jgi:hypothetical protein
VPPSHEEVLEAGRKRAKDMQGLVADIVARMPMAEFREPLAAERAFAHVAPAGPPSFLQRALPHLLGGACLAVCFTVAPEGAPRKLLLNCGLYMSLFGLEAPSLLFIKDQAKAGFLVGAASWAWAAVFGVDAPRFTVIV